MDEFIDAHEATADPNDQLVIHDFSVDFLSAKHIEPSA
jgi:hypothetical protein